MSVEVHHEPDRFSAMEAEDCVDCKIPTRYWLNPHVPLCPSCATKRPGPEICRHCHNEIEPDVCWCGDAFNRHHSGSGHSPVPKGCTCGYAKPDDEWKKKAFDLLLKHVTSTIPADVAIKQMAGIPLVEALQDYVFIPKHVRDRMLAVIESGACTCRTLRDLAAQEARDPFWQKWFVMLDEQIKDFKTVVDIEKDRPKS